MRPNAFAMAKKTLCVRLFALVVWCVYSFGAFVVLFGPVLLCVGVEKAILILGSMQLLSQ